MRPPSFLRTLNDIFVGDVTIKRSVRRWLALALLVAGVVIGCSSFTSKGWLWNTLVSYRPDLLSSAIAFALVLALYLRRVLDFRHSIYTYVSLILNTLITAIIIKALLGKGMPFVGTWPMKWLIGMAVVMTWSGMRPFALLAWAMVVGFGLVNLGAASAAMGTWGVIFLLCLAAGIVLQLEIDVSVVLRELKYDFIGEPDRPEPLVVGEASTSARLSATRRDRTLPPAG